KTGRADPNSGTSVTPAESGASSVKGLLVGVSAVRAGELPVFFRFASWSAASRGNNFCPDGKSSLRTRAQAAETLRAAAFLLPDHAWPVRARGRAALDARAGTVQRDVLSGICGGVTMARYHRPRGGRGGGP